MTVSPSTQAAWDSLPPETQSMFVNIANKPSSDMTAVEWFEHLVPAPLRDNPDEIEVFMNGGTVTQEVWVHDQGVGNGHYEQVTHEIADKDVSRIEAGANGGEYTADNTVMENASINRARGGTDMTPAEFEAAETTNAAESVFIDGGEIATETTTSVIAESAEATSQVLDGLLDGVLPITYGAKAAHHVWQKTAHLDTKERVANTALVGGAVVGGTYIALATVPGLNVVLGGIALYKLGSAAIKRANQNPGTITL